MKTAVSSIKRQARRLFDLAKIDGRVDEARLRAVVAGVAARRPRGCAALLKELLRRTAIETRRHTALVETALPLAASRRETLTGTLMGLYGADVDIRFSRNASLLGGVRIHVADTLIDGSILGRLEGLRSER